MPDFGSEGISSLPLSYYENFLESLAQIVSKLLTDRETEAVISSIRTFQEKLRQLSSRNLQRLNLEISASEKGQSNRCRHTDKTCAQNCTRGFVKTFAVAYSIKYIIGILPSLLTGKIFKKPNILKQMAGRDTIGFALFLSSFISSYKGILCTMRHFRKSTDNGSDRLNAFVAGCVAGSALIFDGDKRRRQSLMLYLFTRALQFNSTWLMKKWSSERQLDHPGKEKWDDRLAKFAQKYSGVAVMMIASAQIVFAYLFHHDTLPRSYFSFLLTHGGFKTNFGKMAAPAAEAVGLTVNQLVEDKSPITIPDSMSTREYFIQNLSPNIGSTIKPKMNHKYILCGIQHPLTDSCAQDKVSLFAEEFLRSAKLYVPLNIIMLVVFRSKQFMTNPKYVGKNFLVSCLRSSLFLTMYVVVGLCTPCWLRRILNRETPWIYAAAGAAAGSMVILEAPGRQLELGLYCLPRAIESLWKVGIKNKWVKGIPHGDILLFMASMGSLMTLYQNDKDTISQHYLSVMTRFFGQN